MRRSPTRRAPKNSDASRAASSSPASVASRVSSGGRSSMKVRKGRGPRSGFRGEVFLHGGAARLPREQGDEEHERGRDDDHRDDGHEAEDGGAAVGAREGFEAAEASDDRRGPGAGAGTTS